MMAEANSTMMYYALARLAKEQGFDDIAETFIASANQEAVHAGFYATLNGRFPKDFWQFAETIMNGIQSRTIGLVLFADSRKAFLSRKNNSAQEKD